MNRKATIALVTGGALVLASFLALASRGEAGDVPTMTVEAAPFKRQVTAEGTLEAVQSTPISAPRELRQPMKIGWIAEDQTWVRSGDPILRFDPSEFRDSLLAGEKERATADNRLLKADTEAGATSRNLVRDRTMAQREYDVADSFDYREVEEIFSRYEVIESGIDKDLALGRRDHADQMQGIRGRMSQAERQLLAIEQRKADLNIDRARSGLSALEITAPHDGILVLKRDWRGELPRVGGNVFPGMPLAQIPRSGAMNAEVYVLEADFGGIEEGRDAKVWIESEPGRVWTAKVTRVDKVAKPRFRGVPVQFFGVTLSLDESDPRLMKPGARVRATIELANEQEAIVVPRQAIQEREGQSIVWKREGRDFIAVPVQTGPGTAGRVLVTSGLADGDEVALENPETRRSASGDQRENRE